MPTSDRIVVLDRSRLVQVGRPAEIFDRLKTRFVAEFVGKANILTGRVEGGGRLLLADGVTIRLNGAGGLAQSSEVSICLRPHNIMFVADPAGARDLADQGYNLFTGTIRRSIYFGDAVDYTLDLGSSASLRVIAPPSQRVTSGQSIHAAAHPDNCAIVRED